MGETICSQVKKNETIQGNLSHAICSTLIALMAGVKASILNRNVCNLKCKNFIFHARKDTREQDRRRMRMRVALPSAPECTRGERRVVGAIMLGRSYAFLLFSYSPANARNLCWIENNAAWMQLLHGTFARLLIKPRGPQLTQPFSRWIDKRKKRGIS